MKISKVIFATLFSILLLSASTNTYAKEKDVYQSIIDKYNHKYNISLELESVSQDYDVNEFERFVSDLAIHERATLDYIQNREEYNVCNTDEMFPFSILPAAVSWHYTTDTKTALTASYGSPSLYSITATYKCYTNPNGNPMNTVGDAQNVSVSASSNALTVNSYSMSSWSQKNLDAGRTLGITTKGTLSQNFILTGEYVQISNVTVYAEFRYK